MNIQTLREHLKLELAGEPFSNPDLEDRRQRYIASIVDLIIEANDNVLSASKN